MTQNAIDISRYGADNLGGEKTHRKEIRNLIAGNYTLRVVSTGFKETLEAGDGWTLKFEIVKSDNGEAGERDYMQLIGMSKLQKDRNATDITFLLRALGVPEEELKAVYVAQFQDASTLAGALVDAKVVDETYFSKKHQKTVTAPKVRFFKHVAG